MLCIDCIDVCNLENSCLWYISVDMGCLLLHVKFKSRLSNLGMRKTAATHKKLGWKSKPFRTFTKFSNADMGTLSFFVSLYHFFTPSFLLHNFLLFHWHCIPSDCTFVNKHYSAMHKVTLLSLHGYYSPFFVPRLIHVLLHPYSIFLTRTNATVINVGSIAPKGMWRVLE